MKEETTHDLFEGLIPQLQQLNKNLENICKTLDDLVAFKKENRRK